MKKTLLFLLISWLFLAPGIFAEEPRQDSRGYTCLDFEHCSSWTDGGVNKECEPLNDPAVHMSTTWSHRSQISLDELEELPTNSQVLITECIDAGIDLNGDNKNDPICTTGDSAQDKFLFCGRSDHPNPICDHYTLLREKPNVGYSLERSPTYGIYYLINGIYQKSIGQRIAVGADGKPVVGTVEWESYTKDNLFRKFIGWYFIPDQTAPTQIPISGSPNISPAIGGQQQAILSFPTYIPSTTSPAVDVEECEGKQYDPYGRVFDMKTLEPIPLADILLKQKNPQGIFDSEHAKVRNPLIFNPFPSGPDGEYLFFVENGDYSLEPRNLNGYLHPASDKQALLSTNALKIYSDLYFQDSPPIAQRGAIQHRDIPLMPNTDVGKTYNLQILTENTDLTVQGTIKFSGKVSHPFAEVVIEKCKKINGVEVCNNSQIYNQVSGGADKFGNFSITLDQKQLEAGEYYKRSFRKVNLATIDLTQGFNFNNVYKWLLSFVQPGAVSAQEEIAGAAIQPIVSYIEGFAYDNKGDLLANAQVNLKIPLSDAPVYQTITNDKGYYKITSEFIPKMEYAVEYVSPGTGNTSTDLTTSQLLAQNKEFIAAEKVNPYLITTVDADPRKNVIPTYVPSAKISANLAQGNVSPSITGTAEQIQNSSGMNNNIFLIGGIMLILVATVGTLIGIHLYKKRTQESSEI